MKMFNFFLYLLLFISFRVNAEQDSSLHFLPIQSDSICIGEVDSIQSIIDSVCEKSLKIKPQIEVDTRNRLQNRKDINLKKRQKDIGISSRQLGWFDDI